MKKINYYLAFNAALNDPEECEEIEEIQSIMRCANMMGCAKIIIIRYDIDHLLKFAKKKDGEGWVEIVSTLEEVQETTKKHFISIIK